MASPVPAIVMRVMGDLLGERPPMSDGHECHYCSLSLPYDASGDPNEHLTTCVWGRAARYLRGLPLDGGVQP